MVNKYDYGIYRGINYSYDYKDKDENMRNYVFNILNKSLTMFKYEGLPETIPQVELEKMLQVNGYVCITKVNGSLYALQGGMGGEPDEYYNPTTIVISNPSLKFNKTLKIGDDCIIVKNDFLNTGMLPIINRYCKMLVENDITMVLTTINKRVDNIITANDDNTYTSAKEFLNKIEGGSLSVIMENALFNSVKSLPTSEGGFNRLSDLFEYHQYIKASLYNEIGLNTNNNMKKERLISDENTFNTDNLYPFVDNMLENRKMALEQVNVKYGTNITVEFNSSWKHRVIEGLPIDDDIEPVEPIEEPVEPIEEPVEPIEEPVEPIEEPVEPVDDDKVKNK